MGARNFLAQSISLPSFFPSEEVGERVNSWKITCRDLSSLLHHPKAITKSRSENGRSHSFKRGEISPSSSTIPDFAASPFVMAARLPSAAARGRAGRENFHAPVHTLDRWV